MTQDKKEAVELLLANRLYIYSMFYKVFGREPDAQMVSLLTDGTAGEAFGLLSSEDGDIMARAALFLSKIGEESKENDFVDHLKSEYMRLYVGPVRLVAPAWESMYRGKESMLFTETTLEVRQFYSRYGMQAEGYPHVADDSLALEMAFMMKLAERAEKAFAEDNSENLRTDLQGSLAFLDEHLLYWIPKYLEKLKDSDTEYLYPQMSLFLDDFLRKDRGVLADIIAEL